MVDQISVGRVVALAALVPGFLLFGLFLAAIVARLRGRAVGRVWQRLLAAAVGGHFGFAMLLSGRLSMVAPVALFAAMLIGLWLLWIGRRTEAAWFAFAAAAPWSILWGFFVVHVIAGADFEPSTTVAKFLLGAVPTAIALIVALAGDPPPPEPRADAPVGQPGSRRIGNMTGAIRAAMSVGPTTTMELAGIGTLWAVAALAAVIGTVLLPIPPVVQAIGFVTIGPLVASEVALRAVPSRVRRALEAFVWLGEWELERARRLGLPTTITHRRAERWLARVPERAEDRWMRWECLVLVSRLDEAAQVAARMPETTAVERFDRAYALDRVDWAGGGGGDPDGLRAAAADIGPLTDDDRLRAEVALAIRESQGRAADGGDVLGPLVDVRDRLGSRPDARIGGLHRRRMRLAMFVSAIIVAAVIYPMGPIVDAVLDVAR